MPETPEPETPDFERGRLESVTNYFNVFVRWANSDGKYELYAGSPDREQMTETALQLLLSGAATVYLVETLATGQGVIEPT